MYNIVFITKFFFRIFKRKTALIHKKKPLVMYIILFTNNRSTTIKDSNRMYNNYYEDFNFISSRFSKMKLYVADFHL